MDGGGTTTRAVLVDEHGIEVGRAATRGSVATAHAPETVVEAVREALSMAADDAGITLPVTTLWAGLAGAGQSEARAAVHERLRHAGLAKSVVVGTDVEAAFASAFGEGPGVLLIAGTGSIAWARSEDGTVRRTGGWGQQLGDEGSGYWIGRAALTLLTRARDGRAPETALERPVLDACGVTDVSHLVAWVATASKGEIASLTPVVAAVAAEGDEGATGIIEDAVRELSTLVAPLDASSGSVVLWGGLIAGGGPLSSAVRGSLSADGWTIADVAVDPPHGAALSALRGTAAQPVPE